jgi:hypothetical protein
MESIIKNKALIAITVIFIVAMLGYRMFSGDPQTSTGESAVEVGKDLLRISDQLSQAQLSQDLFSIPGYKYLTDFTAPIPQESLGRANPFSIIGQQ